MDKNHIGMRKVGKHERATRLRIDEAGAHGILLLQPRDTRAESELENE